MPQQPIHADELSGDEVGRIAQIIERCGNSGRFPYEAAAQHIALLVSNRNEVERLREALHKIAEHDGVSYRYGDEVRAIANAALDKPDEQIQTP